MKINSSALFDKVHKSKLIIKKGLSYHCNSQNKKKSLYWLNYLCSYIPKSSTTGTCVKYVFSWVSSFLISSTYVLLVHVCTLSLPHSLIFSQQFSLSSALSHQWSSSSINLWQIHSCERVKHAFITILILPFNISHGGYNFISSLTSCLCTHLCLYTPQQLPLLQHTISVHTVYLSPHVYCVNVGK